MGLGLLFFRYASNEGIWLLVPFIILFGIGWGSIFPIRAALIREYFGRRNFGTIFGSMMGMISLGTIIEPLFAGWVFDNWGSYHAAWLLFACIVLISSIIMATTPSAADNIRRGDNREYFQGTN